MVYVILLADSLYNNVSFCQFYMNMCRHTAFIWIVYILGSTSWIVYVVSLNGYVLRIKFIVKPI